MTTALPPRLAPWEEALAGLDARLASELGPMLRTLDELVRRHEVSGGSEGDPDGYDGTTNTGDLGRLLMDEWLLADELPEEFVRRAAENELAFLRRAHAHVAPRGRVIAVVDTGPEQLGPSRLVQLAALAVLHRRSRSGGKELEVRLVPSGRRLEGELAQVLPEWLRARTTELPTSAHVEAALDDVGHEDHVWLLAGSSVDRATGAHRRRVSSRVSAWGTEGARRMSVAVGDATAYVDLPEGPAAVAALRGEGLLRRAAPPAAAQVETSGTGAVFATADARLLWRGAAANEVYGCFVAGGSELARVRRYVFTGTVVAAASLGRRIVAAVTDGSTLWIQVVGKKLGRVDRIHVRLADLGLDPHVVAEMVNSPLPPLHLVGGNLLVRMPSGWFMLEAEVAHAEESMLAVGPGPALDAPFRVVRTPTELVVGGHRWATREVAGGPFLGNGAGWPTCAWSEDSRVWRVVRGDDELGQIAVDEGDRVVGLAEVGGTHALIVVSPSGRIVRQVGFTQTRTWTRWAGPAHFDVHPQRPWLARTTEGRIMVGDLVTGDTLLDIRVSE